METLPLMARRIRRILLICNNYDSYSLAKAGETVNLTLFNAYGDVTWSSSDESVATVVGNNGGTATVTLRAAGDAVITATSASNSAVSAVCPVT